MTFSFGQPGAALAEPLPYAAPAPAKPVTNAMAAPATATNLLNRILLQSKPAPAGASAIFDANDDPLEWPRG